MNDKIVIAECYSSAVNYIHDIRSRGYEPVLLERYAPEEERQAIRASNDKVYAFNGDPIPLVITAGKCYAETLRMMRALSPSLILSGSEAGLELSLRLSSDLGLKSNPLSIFRNIRDKYSMQMALKRAGIRYIKSRPVLSEEEAGRLFIRESDGRSVIKTTQGCGSAGVFICGSEDKDEVYMRCARQILKHENMLRYFFDASPTDFDGNLTEDGSLRNSPGGFRNKKAVRLDYSSKAAYLRSLGQTRSYERLSALCIITCAAVTLISFFIPDYSENGGASSSSGEEKTSIARVGGGHWLLIIVFCLFFCAGAVFTNNTEVFLGERLGGFFSEQKTILIFGAVVWASRLFRLGTNIMLTKILDLFKERIILTAPAVMGLSFLAMGTGGILFKAGGSACEFEDRKRGEGSVHPSGNR